VRGTSDAGTGIVGGCVSVTLALSVVGLTAAAAWVAGLGLAALVLLGWRKPARAQARRPRGDVAAAPVGVPVDHRDAPLYRRPNPIRRLLAAMASSGLVLVTGAVLAIVLSFAAAWAVITLTDLLKR
jgi:hypothetical protein